jgi:hypothetical protein
LQAKSANPLLAVADTFASRLTLTHGQTTAEVAGSQLAAGFLVAALSTEIRPIGHSALVPVTLGDTLRVQMTSAAALNLVADSISPAGPTGPQTAPTSATITIVRIQ